MNKYESANHIKHQEKEYICKLAEQDLLSQIRDKISPPPSPKDDLLSNYEDYSSNDIVNNNFFDYPISNRTLDLIGYSTDLRNYLLDSGASSHFTPHLKDLMEPISCKNQVMLADGILVKATKTGEVNINFTSEQGQKCNLKLKRVLHIPGLNRRLFIIPAFVRDSSFRVTFNKNNTRLHFGDGQTFAIPVNRLKNSAESAIQIPNPPILDNTN